MSAKDITIDVHNLEVDFNEFKAWWIKQNNTIKHALKTAIGVRNNKIAEQAGRLTKIEAKNESLTGVCYELSSKIGTLEKQLKEKDEMILTLKELHDHLCGRVALLEAKK